MTRTTLLRSATVAGVIVVLTLACLRLWWHPSEDVIPGEFRGTWLDKGADCQDVAAQVRITGSTISYDRLSYKADGVTAKQAGAVSLTGVSYPDGGAERETVQLRIPDRRNGLFIVAPDLRHQGPFFRCVPDGD